MAPSPKVMAAAVGLTAYIGHAKFLWKVDRLIFGHYFTILHAKFSTLVHLSIRNFCLFNWTTDASAMVKCQAFPYVPKCILVLSCVCDNYVDLYSKVKCLYKIRVVTSENLVPAKSDKNIINKILNQVATVTF